MTTLVVPCSTPAPGGMKKCKTTKRHRGSCRWKEQLREACLRRALLNRRQRQQRRNRNEIPVKNTHGVFSSSLESPMGNISEYDHMGFVVDVDDDTTTGGSSCSPRFYLEQELRNRGVHVEPSPILNQRDFSRRIDTAAMDVLMEDTEMTDELDEEHLTRITTAAVDDKDIEFPETMTEDEFIELLEEIEAEIDMTLLEEELDHQDGLLQDQIAYFENNGSQYISYTSQAEGGQNDQKNPTYQQPFIQSTIPCPLCIEGRLLQKIGAFGSKSPFPSSRGDGTNDEFGNVSISCSQSHPGVHSRNNDLLIASSSQVANQCSFSLGDGVTTLQQLQKRIETAQATHADYCSQPSLTFSNPTPFILTASCAFCNTCMRIYV